jgi:hypothetical protein
MLTCSFFFSFSLFFFLSILGGSLYPHQHMIHFWHIWARRVEALQEHFALRKMGLTFAAWQALWLYRKEAREYATLADMHYENASMQRAFMGWENSVTDRKLQRRVRQGAIAWGRRRLVQRIFVAWQVATFGSSPDQ